MSTEQCFLRWLRREDKEFSENLQFAIKAWKCSEFTFSRKYDLILNWVAEEGSKTEGQNLPIEEYLEILQLRAHPALISLESKRKFVKSLLKQPKATTTSRIFSEILYKLLALEWMQDLVRSDYKLTARIYGRLLQCYEAYLNENNSHDKSQVADFFATALRLLKEHLKNSGDHLDWLIVYDSDIIQPLTQVILTLHVKYYINFIDELRELEEILRATSEDIINHLLKLPMHSAMLTLECLVLSRRLNKKLLENVLRNVFSDSATEDQRITIDYFLLRGVYVLDIFRKHNVPLNFDVEAQTALTFLGLRIYDYAKDYKEIHLREVLLLLCAALRLNPLILEHHVFEITTWMIFANKTTRDNGETLILFEEYLSLLLDMFRRLRRAEKFVVNLLKAVKEWLSKNELPPITSSPRKHLKRKMEDSQNIPSKMTKLSDGTSRFIHFSNDKYTEMLFHDFQKQLQSTKRANTPSDLQRSFVYLQFAWPSSTIGYSFSCLVTGLVVKASLTIWKTLLYALKDQLSMLNNGSMDSENAHFRLDFHAALLCQYFVGARPTEQYEKYITEIIQLRMLTKDVLSQFGQFLLSSPYQERITNAFLECSIYASNLELLLAYYKPDGLDDESLVAYNVIRNLHMFLKPQQWKDLEQRITDSGKIDCHPLFERLKLQRLEAEKLLEQARSDRHILGYGNEVIQPLRLLHASTNETWILSQLSRKEKIKLIKYKMRDISSLEENNFLEYVSENAESLELLSYALFEHLCTNFSSHCKSSLLGTLNCDFKSIRQCSVLDHQGLDKIIKTIVNIIVQSSLNYDVKSIPVQIVKHVLEIISLLPLGHLRRQTKSLLFAFYVAFYQDLKMAQADKEAEYLFESLTDLLHFGQQIPIFRFFEMTKMLQLLPIAHCWDFYQFLFSTIKNEEKGTDEFLRSLEELLSNCLNTTGSLSSDERRLLVIAIETLSSLSGQVGRRVHKHLHLLLLIYEEYVYMQFKGVSNSKKDKKFVEKTLPAFAPFTKAVIGATISNKTNEDGTKNDDESKSKPQSQKSLKPLDENFRRICKIYIGHSMDYRNPHAIQLTQVALKNRKLLHLDWDEIELVLNTYWRQLNADLKQKPEVANENLFETKETLKSVVKAKTSEALVKMIIDNKTNEDFLLTLKDIESNMIDEQSFGNVVELLALISKSSFSTIKGAIFNEQFKEIMGIILLRCSKIEQQKFADELPILKILASQQAFIDNRTIPLTPDTLDTILGFLIDINIKKYHITDTNIAEFFSLHAAISSLCLSLIKQRHILLMDRVPQFMHIFKDLLQTIILYKSDRQKDTSLNPEELNELAEIALKLEVLMHAITMHKTDIKRVAPFVLIFVISLMVSDKRSTTLYPKIKAHIEAICYSLIGMCDHRVGRFILRCSNEASRQIYESLVKDHLKYHKFKGKV